MAALVDSKTSVLNGIDCVCVGGGIYNMMRWRPLIIFTQGLRATKQDHLDFGEITTAGAIKATHGVLTTFSIRK